jgi:hypothetical protein
VICLERNIKRTFPYQGNPADAIREVADIIERQDKMVNQKDIDYEAIKRPAERRWWAFVQQTIQRFLEPS